jgi:murein DD-endopeptidase MepM/ murein hydrolase activator NlpD
MFKKILIIAFIILVSYPVFALEVTVKKGDTLYGLSQEYNVSIRELIEENKLKRPYVLQIGQKIKIPLDVYTVKQIDNISTIANKFNVYEKEILSLNKINNVRSGQTIFIPKSTKVIEQDKTSIQIGSQARFISKPSNISFRQSYEDFFEQNSFKGKFSWPLRGKILERFGAGDSGTKSLGITVKAPLGNDVFVSNAGLVEYVGRNIKGYGNLVIVRHGIDWLSLYANLDKIFFREGEFISKGQRIGTVGVLSSGDDSGIFFALRNRKDPVDPLLKLTR